MRLKNRFFSRFLFFLSAGIFLLFILSSAAGAQAATWTGIGPGGGKVTALAVDPKDSRFVYCVINQSRLFKSTDGGENWISVSVPGPGPIMSLVINPQDPAVIYIAKFVGNSVNDGIYKTFDRCESWNPVGVKGGIMALAMDPSHPETLYAAGSNNGVVKTTDGGVTWSKMNEGLDISGFPGALAIDPRSSQTVYLSIRFSSLHPEYPGALYKTNDGGQNWTLVNTQIKDEWLLVDPRDSSLVYAWGINLLGTMTPFGRLMKSYDGGSTFAELEVGGPVASLAVSPGPGGDLYAGTKKGALRSSDGGKTWTGGAYGLIDPNICSLAVDPHNPLNVYAGAMRRGVFKSRNRGASWEESNKGLINGNRLLCLAADPENALTVFIAESCAGEFGFGGIFKTSNGGRTWESKFSGIEACGLAIDTKNPLIVYAGGINFSNIEHGVWKSTNGGESWDLILPYEGYIAIDPLNASTLYVAGERLYKSLDAGANWTQLSNAGQYLWRIAIDPSNPLVLYVRDNNHEIRKSMDGGNTWEIISEKFPKSASLPTIDPSSSQTLFVFSQTGLYKSTDGGVTWMLKINGLPSGLPDYSYLSRLIIDPRTPMNIHACIDGKVYRSMDGAESWSDFSDGIPSAGKVSELALSQNDPSAIFCTALGYGVYATGLPAGPALTADLSLAAAVFINKNYQLRKIDASGAISQVLTPDVHTAQFQYDPQGRLIVTFFQPERLADDHSYLLVRVDPTSNAVMGIDASLTNMAWNLGSVNPNVQTDYAGNIYYLAWTDGGRLVLRRWSQDGSIANFLNADVNVSHWQVRWDGTVVLAGGSVGSASKWLKRISPEGTISNILPSGETGWVLQLPDNLIYAGFPYPSSSGGPWGVYRLSPTLTPISSSAILTPLIGDSKSGFQPEYDVSTLSLGHPAEYCRALTEWAGGKMLGYADDMNGRAYALLGDEAFQTLIKLFPTPEVLEIAPLDRIKGIKAMQGRLVVHGTKAGVEKLIVIDASTGTETTLTSGNIKIYQYDVISGGQVFFDGLDLGTNQVVIGVYKPSGASSSETRASAAGDYKYNELARLGDESERPMDFAASRAAEEISSRAAVIVTAPEPAAIVSGLIQVKASAAAEAGISKIEFFVDSVSKSVNTSGPYGFGWDTSFDAEGVHILSAKVFDLYQNTAEHRIEVRICNTAPGQIVLGKNKLIFGARTGGPATSGQVVSIGKTGGGTLLWTVTPSAPWIRVQPSSGVDSGVFTISIDSRGIGEGTYSGTVSAADPSALNSPQQVEVVLHVNDEENNSQPFGSFDTPIDGSMGITGAIPFCGWALDDIEVAKIEIERDSHFLDPPGAIGPDGLVYIGDAIFVEGARPDVEQSYTGFPLNTRAGWGYMMLTNSLPNGGNGIFKLYAIATDREGNKVLLGAKTITCDNAHAVNPFGTIDTPGQGGNASGNTFVNFGWVLTPMPKTVPKDGSTISVWVDGVKVGDLKTAPNVYNQYRADVSTTFPGLNNTGGPGAGGPVGAFFIDLTKYANGMHTISWVAFDDAGQGEGIGSRYFNILNTGTAANELSHCEPLGVAITPHESIQNLADILNLPMTFEALRVKTGFDLKAEPVSLAPDNYGVCHVEIPEVNRLEISLDPAHADQAGNETAGIGLLDPYNPPTPPFRKGGEYVQYAGYQIVGSELRPLPIGSTLDQRNGTFSWLPGPGFIGSYNLVLIREENGVSRATKIIIDIRPNKYQNEGAKTDKS